MDEAGFITAKNYTLRLLSFRPRTVAEVKLKLRVYLKKKNLEENILNKVIENLLEIKLLDDREFATWFIKSRQSNAIKGNKIVALELVSKGIDKEIIDDLVKSGNPEDEINKAKKIIEKKLSLSFKNTSPKLLKLKLREFLYRKGFDMDTIKKAIDVSYQKS